MQAIPGPTRADDALGAVLAARVASATPLPSWIDASIALRPTGREPYTIRARRGRMALEGGEPSAPTTTITADPATLRRVVMGAQSGVAAFLDGSLRVRGSLALSLRMAGMWRGSSRHLRARDVVADGVRTFLIEAGQGPPVVLLHGLGATNASMLPTFDALARTHRVIAPDLPGFGDSGKPVRPLHAAYFARWLTALLDRLGIERASLIGNSMGGRLAIEVGLRSPERVDRLVLLAPSPAFLSGRELVRLVRLLRPELGLVPLPVRRGAVLTGIRGMFARPDRLPPAWYDAAADEFLRVFRTARGRMSFFSAARQIYLEEPYERPGGFWGRLPDLAPPALFIWGDRDRLVPARFARHVQQALPGAGSVVLRSSGHVPQFEQPEATHRLVRNFLG